MCSISLSQSIDPTAGARAPCYQKTGGQKKTTTGTTNGWRRETQTEVIYMYIYIYTHHNTEKKKVMLVTIANQSMLQWIPGQIPADSQ